MEYYVFNKSEDSEIGLYIGDGPYNLFPGEGCRISELDIMHNSNFLPNNQYISFSCRIPNKNHISKVTTLCDEDFLLMQMRCRYHRYLSKYSSNSPILNNFFSTIKNDYLFKLLPMFDNYYIHYSYVFSDKELFTIEDLEKVIEYHKVGDVTAHIECKSVKITREENNDFISKK